MVGAGGMEVRPGRAVSTPLSEVLGDIPELVAVEDLEVLFPLDADGLANQMGQQGERGAGSASSLISP